MSLSAFPSLTKVGGNMTTTVAAYALTNTQTRMNNMTRHFISLLLTFCFLSASAQERKVENRPYTDLRPFHFGVLVGSHLQDIEFRNVGPQMIELEGGGTTEKLVLADQDRWDAGFTVGVLGEFRLSRHFQFRVAPTMYFGTRHITFRNMTDLDINGAPTLQRQDIKTAYIASSFDMIFAAPRFNNHRPYLMAGISPMINLTGKSEDYLRLKRSDVFLEVGLGCDFYLPFFKLRPELKFMYGITNSLDTNHYKEIKDRNMLMYTNSVNSAHSKMIALTFYFE